MNKARKDRIIVFGAAVAMVISLIGFWIVIIMTERIMAKDEQEVDYGSMTNDEFREILEEFVGEEGVNILSIGDVYTILAEHFNNDVLDRWAERNEERAYPPREEEEDDD